jgi:hypothetical protein
MLPRSSVHFIPAGKAPQRGADAVKACYPPSEPLLGIVIIQRALAAARLGVSVAH